MLTGRSIVCGSPSFLFYHGLDYSRRQEDVRLAYERPEENLERVAGAYGADYILLSSWELGSFDVDRAWIEANCERVFYNGECALYAIS